MCIFQCCAAGLTETLRVNIAFLFCDWKKLLIEFPSCCRVRKLPPDTEPDFTDRAYQNRLPMHARSTATQAVKNNLRITEIQADSSLILNAQKVCRERWMNISVFHRSSVVL